MKIKILGDWFGLSFGVFLLVAALLAIPAGEWIGGCSTWLQVAAPTREDSAHALANALAKKGYPVFVKEPRRDTLYRVQVGPYPDRQGARTAAQALQADGFEVIVMG